MGQLVSKKAREKAREEERAKARSDAIDHQIIEDSIRYKKDCKILLLGSGGSGKSTIVKHLKIIHQAGFDTRERSEYRTTIYKNVLDSAATLARVVRRVGLGAFEAREERGWAGEVLRAFPPVPRAVVGGDGAGALDGEMDDGWDGDDDEIDVGLDPVPLTRGDRYYEYHERECGGIPTGRVSARPGTAGGPTPAAAVLAQTHAVLTPALADAIWHVARAPAVEKLVDEHPADFYIMDSGRRISSPPSTASPTHVRPLRGGHPPHAHGEYSDS
ncbi:G-protein alpha subunit-domain-containing protein [Mycena olivaceomarginata]|nr:G-protein alpha subunit-domain-containing protein [Mycena olivaceomarginata]